MTPTEKADCLRQTKADVIELRSLSHMHGVDMKNKGNVNLQRYYHTQAIAFNQVIRMLDNKISNILMENENEP